MLAFDPFKDIQSSNLSSGETALVDMALNQVHMSDALTMSSLSCVDHVLFSINTLRHLGDFQLREEAIHSDCAKGDLIHMLYSVAVAMHADPAMVFWGVLAETDLKPLSVSFLICLTFLIFIASIYLISCIPDVGFASSTIK